MRQQFGDASRRLRRQPLHDVLEVRVGVVPVDPSRVHQAHDRRSAFARAQAAREQPVRAPEGDRTDLVFDPVVVTRNIAIVEVARERRPSTATVVDGLRNGGAIGNPGPLGVEPAFECVGDGRRLVLPQSSSLVRPECLGLALDVVQQAEELDRLLGDRAPVGDPQLVELASRVCIMWCSA